MNHGYIDVVHLLWETIIQEKLPGAKSQNYTHDCSLRLLDILYNNSFLFFVYFDSYSSNKIKLGQKYLVQYNTWKKNVITLDPSSNLFSNWLTRSYLPDFLHATEDISSSTIVRKGVSALLSFFIPPFFRNMQTPSLGTHHEKKTDFVMMHWNQRDWKQLIWSHGLTINLCINFKKHNRLVSLYTDNFWKTKPSWKEFSIDL